MLQWPLPAIFLQAEFIAVSGFADSTPIGWPTVVRHWGLAFRVFCCCSVPHV